jgi:glucose/mannose-6-phosphate isomerase
MNSTIDVAAEHLESCVIEWGPDARSDSLAKQIAMGLHGTIPVIAGAGITEPIAYRWKTQINENAKLPAFAHELPELDHNEICGWDGAPELGKFSAVFLQDADQHPRVRERFELTEQLIVPNATSTYSVATVGRTAVERVMSLVLLGDLVSLYLAVLRGVDPTPVDILVRLKAQLADR